MGVCWRTVALRWIFGVCGILRSADWAAPVLFLRMLDLVLVLVLGGVGDLRQGDAERRKLKEGMFS